MNIHELSTYNLDDAVKFHQRLNPVLWGRDEHLLPEVRDKLLRIAADFQEFLGVEDLKVKDITVSGSNAAYSYTKQSDIDLHLVVEMPNDPVYQELFAAKKYQYNTEHDITIGGADVELYVQPDDQLHHSQGIYSIKNSDWVKVPQRKRSQIDDTCVQAKVDDLATRIQSAVASQDRSVMDLLWKKIKIMRQTGLENHGEFGCENVSFKLLRNNGSIGALKSAITAAQDRELSLPPKKRVRYGFSEDVTVTPDGVSASTNMFLNETPVSSVVQSFVQDVVQRLGIEHMPEVVLHDDPDWSKQNNSFGQYNPDTRTLHVSLIDRHLLDILRTVAHELTHCRQNELNTLPDHAGETGSRWENEANAQAGILMRDFADANPEYFTESYSQAKSLQSSMKTFRAKVRIKDRYNTTAIETQVVARNYDMAKQLLKAQYGPDSVIGTVTELKENASGYIPKNKKETAQPQYAMALSVDIKPGEEDLDEGSKQKPVTIYTNPANQGATVDDSIKKSLPVIQVPFDKLQQWESHKTMQDPRVADWVNTNLLPQLQQNGVLDPLSVWDHDGELFVIDGNHRFVAYQEAGYNGRVPVQIVPDEMITIVDTVMNEQGVAEELNFDEIYGKYLKVTDNSGDPGEPGFSLVTPLNGESWNWRERPEFKDLVKQKLNDPGFLGDHKYQQIIDAMSGKQFDPTKHIAKENFADGKNPGRKGLSKRVGVNTKASVSSLRKTAKNSSGEKQRMAHWLANMKAGRAKAKRK